MPPTPTFEPTATAVEPPAEIGPLAAWIEVDLARQVVVLHADGAILSSHAAASGRTGVAGAATPPGPHRVQSLR
jgi:hypothetical protein